MIVWMTSLRDLVKKTRLKKHSDDETFAYKVGATQIKSILAPCQIRRTQQSSKILVHLPKLVSDSFSFAIDAMLPRFRVGLATP